MGKKKKKDKEEAKPWCYYCDRVFNDEATLVLHQKTKHFKCTTCNRKLSSAQGLLVHAYQVHKENVTSVPGAKPGRDSMEHEIFGMAGVPDGMKPGGVMDDAEQPVSKRHKADSTLQQAAGSYPPKAAFGGPPSYPASTYTHIPPAQSAGVPVPGASAGLSYPQPPSYTGYSYPAYPPAPQPLGAPPFLPPPGPPAYPGYHPQPGAAPPPLRPGPGPPPGPQYQPIPVPGQPPYFPPRPPGPPGPLGLMPPPSPTPLFPVAGASAVPPQPGPLFPVTVASQGPPASQLHAQATGGAAAPAPLFPVTGAGPASPGSGAAAAALGPGAPTGAAHSTAPVPVPAPQ